MKDFTWSHGCTLPYFAIVYCLFQHVSMFATTMSPARVERFRMLGKRLGMAQARAEAEAGVWQQISTDFNSPWLSSFKMLFYSSLSSHNLRYVFGSFHEAAQSQSSEAAQQQEAGEPEKSEKLQLRPCSKAGVSKNST